MDILQIHHIYLTYFSVGALIPTFFDLFLAFLFLYSIKIKSKATLHLGIAFLYLGLFNLAYFFAASVYAPGAAFHRWGTVGIVTLAQTHFIMFLLNLHREAGKRANRIILVLLYTVSLFTTAFFFINTFNADAIYYFAGHYWDFNADRISEIVAYIIMAYIATLIFLVPWKMRTTKGRDRWIILLIAVVIFITTGPPSYLNILSRDGAMDRGTYQIVWDLFNMVGLFTLTVIYINYTRDRTSFMSKIVGISLVTLLAILQMLGYYFYEDKEAAYNAIHQTRMRLSLATEYRYPDTDFIVGFSPVDKSIKNLYIKNDTYQDSASFINKQQLLNTLAYYKIKQIEDRGFRENLHLLMKKSRPEFEGYRNFILASLSSLDKSGGGYARQVLHRIEGLKRTLLFRYNKINKLSDDRFRQAVKKFLSRSSGDFNPFKKAILRHLTQSSSEGRNLKEEVLQYLIVMSSPGSRIYLKQGPIHYVAFSQMGGRGDKLYIAGFSYLAYRQYLHPFSIKLTIMLFAIMLIVVVFFRFFFMGSLVLPLNRLLSALDEVRKGHLDIQIPVQVDDEIGVLSRNFNRMVSSIKAAKVEIDNYTNNLEQMVHDRTEELKTAMDSLWGEMELAKKIQTVLLPENPEIEGFEISAHMAPADEVGGDYYDVINVGGRDWLVIGDVSGHGVPAGLIMMMVQTSIRTVLTQDPEMPPSNLLSVINKTISYNIKQLGEDKYMTITVLALYDKGKFSFSGLHQDIFIFRAASASVEIIETKGMWIGIVEDIGDMISDDSVAMNTGDCMLLYTDGITEARDSAGVMYSDKKLRDYFEKIGNKPCVDIKNAILKSLEDYICNDDVTLVVLKKNT